MVEGSSSLRRVVRCSLPMLMGEERRGRRGGGVNCGFWGIFCLISQVLASSGINYPAKLDEKPPPKLIYRHKFTKFTIVIEFDALVRLVYISL